MIHMICAMDYISYDLFIIYMCLTIDPLGGFTRFQQVYPFQASWPAPQPTTPFAHDHNQGPIVL